MCGIAGILDLCPVHLEPGLREFDVGDWSGLTRPEIEARWPGQLDAWRAGELEETPGGELRAHFIGRVVDSVRALAERFDGETVLTVSHGGVIGTVQRALGDHDSRERIGNLSGRWIEVKQDGATPQLVLGRMERLLDPEEFTLSPSM